MDEVYEESASIRHTFLKYNLEALEYKVYHIKVLA